MIGRLIAFAFGLICYAVFLPTFLYAVGFVGDLYVPKAIDDGPPLGLFTSLLINALLLGVFALQHSVMARPVFKRLWTKLIPAQIERSNYVLFSSLALILLFWQWRPIAEPMIWQVTTPTLVAVIWLLFGLGWVTVLSSTFLINHFDLFGLRQVWTYVRNRETPPEAFRTPLFYRVVRHPIYLGFIIAFWASPDMSLGHLFFAFVTTAYILIAIQFEEHDLVNVFGERYRGYQAAVSMIVPWFPGKKL